MRDINGSGRHLVSFRLDSKQMNMAEKFAKLVGISLKEIAKQSLFWAIEEARRRAEEMSKVQQSNKEVTNGQSQEQADVGGVTDTISESRNVHSNADETIQESGDTSTP